MALETLPVWSIEPDWADGLVESLEWVTSVLQTGIDGSEQRQALRDVPQQYIEATFKVHGNVRSFLDQFVQYVGGTFEFYMPLWYDRCRISRASPIGGNLIYVDTNDTDFSAFQVFDDNPHEIPAVFISGSTPFDYTLLELTSIEGDFLQLADGVTLPRTLAKGTLIYPARIFRMEEQPQFTRSGPRVFQGNVKFRNMTRYPAIDTIELATYRGIPTLEQVVDSVNGIVKTLKPNEAQDLAVQWDKLRYQVDPQTNFPYSQAGSTGMTLRQFNWFVKGRSNLQKFRALLTRVIEGRAAGLWIPSFQEDFKIAAWTNVGGTQIDVERCGYTDMGGPRVGRQFIRVEYHDKRLLPYYGEITDASLLGDGSKERLVVAPPLSLVTSTDTVSMISFIEFMRMDQDIVELTHNTDSYGLTTANTVFRTLIEDVGIVSPEDDGLKLSAGSGEGFLAILTIDCLQDNTSVAVEGHDFTDTVNYDSESPPDPGESDYWEVSYPTEDDGAVPDNAWNKVPVVSFANLRTSDLDPVETDPGGVESWTDVLGVFHQYEAHIFKYDSNGHEFDGRYIVGGLDIVDSFALGEPGTIGLYIGDSEFGVLYPDDPTPDLNDRPPIWRDDTLSNLTSAFPDATFRFSVTSPEENTMLLKYQQQHISPPAFTDWSRRVYLINFGFADTINVNMGAPVGLPEGLPNTHITLEIYPVGQVDLHSPAFGPEPPPLVEEPDIEDFAQHVRVRNGIAVVNDSRNVSATASGQIAQFNIHGFL